MNNPNWNNMRDNVQARIKERLSRPTLTESLSKQNEKQAEQKSPWLAEFKADRAVYILMIISAVFTGTLGFFLGLAPYSGTVNGQPGVLFHDDALHIILAVIYASAFVAVTEGAFVVAKHKHYHREEGNTTQQGTMVAMMVIAGVSIVLTGWAGGSVAASVLGFLTDFKEIPHSAQKYIVGVIPVLLAIYTFLLTSYRNSSEQAKSARTAEQLRAKQENDHKLMMDMVELEGEEMMLLAEIEAYRDAVNRGVLTAAQALAARRAGKTLRQLEAELQRDLNNDHIIEAPVPAGYSSNGKKSNP